MDIDKQISDWSDHYFHRTKKTVAKFGDILVTYAVFMRQPICFAPKLMYDWLRAVETTRKTEFQIKLCHEEGDWVGAGEPLVYLTGSFVELVDLETIYLQKLGASCVAAYNAYSMCADMPKTAFLAMDARHCAGLEMADMMAYAAGVATKAVRQDLDAVGFIGNATDATAHYFGNDGGLGTMPHSLIGYAGSTLRAAEMFAETFPDDAITVLVDYYGQEVSDALAVARRFPELVEAGKLSVRLDTHGGRFVEGLDPQSSYQVLDRHAPRSVRQYRTEDELRWLIGTGVSAAAIFHIREKLDENGFGKVKIVASSGFNPLKCKTFGSIGAPADIVGTGSYLPENWRETYATADIVAYDGKPSVKVGREFLLQYPNDTEKV